MRAQVSQARLRELLHYDEISGRFVRRVGVKGSASRGGWQQVPNGQHRYMDAAMRHLLKHGQGETHDPESGLTHLSHAAWNLLAIAELDARGGK